jgi:predicted TIM-barrel fold metal-dependent hydrolase
MFPDIDFVVYHSGFEFPIEGAPEEGPYTAATRDVGCNRLIATMEENGLGHGSNVYAELGSLWFSVIRRPEAAAHSIGKLVKAFGVDNVIWGTDSIWYGGSQPLIDAFRAFQIPDALCEKYGYAKLTSEDKAKIFGLNACRVYGIDPDQARAAARNDDLAWCRQAVDKYRKVQFPGVR